MSDQPDRSQSSRPRSWSHKKGGGPPSQHSKPKAAYNPGLARFKKNNPGSGPLQRNTRHCVNLRCDATSDEMRGEHVTSALPASLTAAMQLRSQAHAHACRCGSRFLFLLPLPPLPFATGPHGFGGTYKKGEKGGHRPVRAEELVPLAERGLQRHGGGAAAAAAGAKPKSSAPSLAASSCSQLKQRIRDLTRLLNKPDLDPIIKQHKERDLARVQAALESKQKENEAAKIDARYKHIKFYEKRKILRKLAGLQRQLSTLYSKSGGDVMSAEEKAIRKQIAQWQLDRDYVEYYPHGEKYIALYANKKKGEEGEEEEEDAPSADEAAKQEGGSDAQSDAVEAARAAMRKRVAQLKAAALREKRQSAAPAAAPKRKRDASLQDDLFQADDSDDDESSQAAADHTVDDDLMHSDDDSAADDAEDGVAREEQADESQSEDEEEADAKPPHLKQSQAKSKSRAKEEGQPARKKQKKH